jgi:aryl-alcohol dehydrogenase-like predicted oxidoreductase
MNSHNILLPVKYDDCLAPWLWIGTWSMGGEGFGMHDERESLRVLEEAVEEGIRHFDTAGFYAHGRSENLLQNVIRSRRNILFISSKGGLVWNGNRVEHRASPEDLRKQLFESLERLKTDYLDLFQLHWPDPEISIIDSINALKEFRNENLIRHWGVGNLSEGEINEYLKGEEHVPHQVHFNPLHRSDNILKEGRGRCNNCIISPLEQGLLGSGKSSHGKEGIGKRDIRNRNKYFSDPEVLRWNGILEELVVRSNIPKVFAVLLWICAQPGVHSIIPGPRREDQLNELLKFKSFVEKHELMSSESEESILSPDKVRKILLPEIWNHLSKGTA